MFDSLCTHKNLQLSAHRGFPLASFTSEVRALSSAVGFGLEMNVILEVVSVLHLQSVQKCFCYHGYLLDEREKTVSRRCFKSPLNV